MHIITAWCSGVFLCSMLLSSVELVDTEFFLFRVKILPHDNPHLAQREDGVVVQVQRAVLCCGHMINRDLEYHCNSFHPKSCIMIAHNCIGDQTSCTEDQYIAFGQSLQVKFAQKQWQSGCQHLEPFENNLEGHPPACKNHDIIALSASHFSSFSTRVTRDLSHIQETWLSCCLL